MTYKLQINTVISLCLIVSLSLNVVFVLGYNEYGIPNHTNLQNKLSTMQDDIENLELKLLQENQDENHSVNLSNQNINSYDSQSITSVGIMPIMVRDGFFEKTIYQGTNMDISVSIRDGTGNVLVNTEVPTGIDFQSSARVAVKQSEEYLGIDLYDKDIIFSISAVDDSTLKSVDGKSAGAAMTILLISEITGKELKEDVVITGTIENDFKIGKVGGIYEKAEAAGKSGAKIFLVPKSQDVTFVESCKESIRETVIYRSCQLEQKPLSPMTEELFGMRVISVESLSEALHYFLIDSP